MYSPMEAPYDDYYGPGYIPRRVSPEIYEPVGAYSSYAPRSYDQDYYHQAAPLWEDAVEYERYEDYPPPRTSFYRGGDYGVPRDTPTRRPPLGAPASKALIVGINYHDQGDRELYGSIRDALSIQKFLELQGWSRETENTRMLTDDHPKSWSSPSYRNIMEGLEWLTAGAKSGDALFFSFAGHATGSSEHGGEHDGLDEALLTIDGLRITDDVLYHHLVTKVPPGVTLTCVIDCGSGGNILDLPYTYEAKNMFQVHQKPGSCRTASSSHNTGRTIVFSGARLNSESTSQSGHKAILEGGACTNALISILATTSVQSWGELLLWMRQKMKQRGLHLAPQVSTNLPMDLDKTVALWPDGRAVEELPGCHELNPLLRIPQREERARDTRARERQPSMRKYNPHQPAW